MGSPAAPSCRRDAPAFGKVGGGLPRDRHFPIYVRKLDDGVI